MSDEERRGMLAWYVSGRLAEDERAEVERSLGADLRREVTEFQLLRAAVAEVGAEEPSFPPNLVQDAWRRIQAFEKEKAARAEARPGARLVRFFDVHIAALWRGASGVGRLALAAQLALVLGLGAALLRAPAEVEYGTASDPGQSVPPVGEPAALQLKVLFTPGATQQDVGTLLRRLDLQIVGGPSSLGLYTVAARGPADAAARDSALAALASALEAEPALVRGVVREAP